MFLCIFACGAWIWWLLCPWSSTWVHEAFANIIGTRGGYFLVSESIYGILSFLACPLCLSLSCCSHCSGTLRLIIYSLMARSLRGRYCCSAFLLSPGMLSTLPQPVLMLLMLLGFPAHSWHVVNQPVSMLLMLLSFPAHSWHVVNQPVLMLLMLLSFPAHSWHVVNQPVSMLLMLLQHYLLSPGMFTVYLFAVGFSELVVVSHFAHSVQEFLSFYGNLDGAVVFLSAIPHSPLGSPHSSYFFPQFSAVSSNSSLVTRWPALWALVLHRCGTKVMVSLLHV